MAVMLGGLTSRNGNRALFWISGCLCDSRRLQSTKKNLLLKSVGINSAARGVMPALPRLASAAKTPPAGPGLSPRIAWLHFPWILPAICVGPSTGEPCHAITRAMPLEPKQEKPALTGLPFPLLSARFTPTGSLPVFASSIPLFLSLRPRKPRPLERKVPRLCVSQL